MSDYREHPVQNDAQLADQLEKAMADPTEWGKPIHESRPRRSEKRQRAAMISIRLTAEELDAVQEAATARGLSVSRYVRECALRPVRSQVASSFVILVSNRTSVDSNTSANMLAPPINVPTATAASPPFFIPSELLVPSAAAS